ncbi:hypothetical protein ADUPG1_009871, partial [Aduncisulcus paluster]
FVFKLGDFGLATQMEQAEEGDARYASPEALQGSITPEGDMFSLGVSVLELCMDINIPDSGKLFHFIRSDSPFILCDTLNPLGISKELRMITKNLLSHNPKFRPTASYLLDHPIVRSIYSRRSSKWIRSCGLRSIIKLLLISTAKSSDQQTQPSARTPSHSSKMGTIEEEKDETPTHRMSGSNSSFSASYSTSFSPSTGRVLLNPTPFGSTIPPPSTRPIRPMSLMSPDLSRSVRTPPRSFVIPSPSNESGDESGDLSSLVPSSPPNLGDTADHMDTASPTGDFSLPPPSSEYSIPHSMSRNITASSPTEAPLPLISPPLLSKKVDMDKWKKWGRDGGDEEEEEEEGQSSGVFSGNEEQERDGSILHEQASDKLPSGKASDSIDDGPFTFGSIPRAEEIPVWDQEKAHPLKSEVSTRDRNSVSSSSTLNRPSFPSFSPSPSISPSSSSFGARVVPMHDEDSGFGDEEERMDKDYVDILDQDMSFTDSPDPMMLIEKRIEQLEQAGPHSSCEANVPFEGTSQQHSGQSTTKTREESRPKRRRLVFSPVSSSPSSPQKSKEKTSKIHEYPKFGKFEKENRGEPSKTSTKPGRGGDYLFSGSITPQSFNSIGARCLRDDPDLQEDKHSDSLQFDSVTPRRTPTQLNDTSQSSLIHSTHFSLPLSHIETSAWLMDSTPVAMPPSARTETPCGDRDAEEKSRSIQIINTVDIKANGGESRDGLGGKIERKKKSKSEPMGQRDGEEYEPYEEDSDDYFEEWGKKKRDKSKKKRVLFNTSSSSCRDKAIKGSSMEDTKCACSEHEPELFVPLRMLENICEDDIEVDDGDNDDIGAKYDRFEQIREERAIKRQESRPWIRAWWKIRNTIVLEPMLKHSQFQLFYAIFGIILCIILELSNCFTPYIWNIWEVFHKIIIH